MPDNFEAARLATQPPDREGPPPPRLRHRRRHDDEPQRQDRRLPCRRRGRRPAAAARRCSTAGRSNEYGDSVIAEVGRATALQIARLRAPPTGIVALNDLMALGLMAGLRDAGLRVPRRRLGGRHRRPVPGGAVEPDADDGAAAGARDGAGDGRARDPARCRRDAASERRGRLHADPAGRARIGRRAAGGAAPGAGASGKAGRAQR